MENIGIHCYIEGRVQGVWYRSSTRKQATQLGLTGWVKNLSDGRVEALICGPTASVELMYQWLQKGPPGAKVTKIERLDIEWQQHDEFLVVR